MDLTSIHAELVARAMYDAYCEQVSGGVVYGITSDEADMLRNILRWHWYRRAERELLHADDGAVDPKELLGFMERHKPDGEPQIRPRWWPTHNFPPAKVYTPGGMVAALCGWLWWNRGGGRNRTDKPERFDEVVPGTADNELRGPVSSALKAIAMRRKDHVV